MAVRVSVLPPEKLLAAAIRSFNRHLDDRAERYGDWDEAEPATPDSDPLFLERIQVNHARHRLSQYDRALEDVAGRVGVAATVATIRARVYRAIAATYPHLADEAERQMARRGIIP